MKTKENTKPSYWYLDNWYGNKQEFTTFRDAKKEASKETGVTITIFRGSEIYKFVPASGFIPS